MNTWCDIKTAPLDTPVLVTSGKYVYLGRIEEYIGLKVFVGTSLQDGRHFNTYATTPFLIGWQSVPDTLAADNNVGTNVPEKNVGKSADEMFRELGYTWEATLGESIIYESMEYEDAVKVNENHVIFYESKESGGLQVPVDTILACARLIKELGWGK